MDIGMHRIRSRIFLPFDMVK